MLAKVCLCPDRTARFLLKRHARWPEANQRDHPCVFSTVVQDPVALSYARKNLINHGLSHRARLCQADLFPSAPTDPYDLIVANPPYIDTAIIATLMPEVSRHEPRLALDGGSGGLDICRRLIQQAPQRLTASGWLLLEHGYDQASSIAQLLTEAGFAQVLPVVKDYGGQPRVSGGCI